jgi:hypothetical protein
MATTEETVRQEQEDWENQQQAKSPDDDQPNDGEGLPPTDEPEDHDPEATGELFDKTKYETEELALPKVDGEGVDKIAVKLNGTVWLERGNEEHVALIKRPRIGQTVTLLVEAEVGPPVPGYTTNRDGDLDALSLSRTFTAKHVSRPAGHDLDPDN